MAVIRSAGLVALLALAASEISPVPELVGGTALAADDECTAEGESACGLHALQLLARPKSAEVTLKDDAAAALQASAQEPLTCQGPWCPTLVAFCRLFDTDDPAKMQQAMNTYGDFASTEDGLTLGLTNQRYYQMYHSNMQKVLARYLPSGYFRWTFGHALQEVPSVPGAEAGSVTIARNGTLSLDLGWKRAIFSSMLLRNLPGGNKFPYSHASSLRDCSKCGARMLFSLKEGGHAGTPGAGWKITRLTLIKLE